MSRALPICVLTRFYDGCFRHRSGASLYRSLRQISQSQHKDVIARLDDVAEREVNTLLSVWLLTLELTPR